MTRPTTRRLRCARKGMVALIAAAVAGSLAIAPADSQEASQENCLVTQANAARSEIGSTPLTENVALDTVAQRHAEQMAAQGQIFHNSELGSQMPPGSRGFGENVGQAESCEQMHGAFMESSVHYANLVNARFSYVGIGQASAEGLLFFVQVFGSYPSAPLAPDQEPVRPPGNWIWVWPWSSPVSPPWPWILPGKPPAPHPRLFRAAESAKAPPPAPKATQPPPAIAPGEEPVRPPGDWTWLWSWSLPTPPPWPWILPGNQPMPHPAILFAPPPVETPFPTPPTAAAVPAPVDTAVAPAPIPQRTSAYSSMLEMDPELLLEQPAPTEDGTPPPFEEANLEPESSFIAVFSVD